jgi:sugar phosphate isomerase/epimerase
MQVDRRDFFKLAAASGAMASISCNGKPGKAPDAKPAVTLNISCQEGVAPGETLAEKLDFMEANGITGLEIWGADLEKRVEEIQKALQNRAIKVSAICAGFKGWLIADDPQRREQAMASTKEILVPAGALGARGMIIVPAFNNQKSLPHQEARQMLIDECKELCEFANQHGTRLLLEPLNRQEAYFLRQVADAASICRDINNPGAAVMGDFWHMTWEETSDMGAFISAGPYLHHVHIASRKRRQMPGEDEGDNYVDGFKGLKMIRYSDFVSFECGSLGDKKITLPAAVKLMREQWDMA